MILELPKLLHDVGQTSGHGSPGDGGAALFNAMPDPARGPRDGSEAVGRGKVSLGIHGPELQPRGKGPLSCTRQSAQTSNGKGDATDKFRQHIVNSELPVTTNGLCAGDAIHRSLGLWAIDTANANVWGGLYNYLQDTAADFVFCC